MLVLFVFGVMFGEENGLFDECLHFFVQVAHRIVLQIVALIGNESFGKLFSAGRIGV